VHEACRSKPGAAGQPTDTASNLGICSRQEFRDVYDYIVAFGADFHTVEFLPNVSAEARIGLEYESKLYYAENYPNVTYNGITTRKLENGVRSVANQTEQPFYWPVHYLEPLYGNEAAIDLDLYSTQQQTIEQATSSWRPIVSNRITLLQETENNSYSVLLYHPGVQTSSEPNKTKPTELALLVIRMHSLLERSAQLVHDHSMTVYIFDNVTSLDSSPPQPPVFLVGATITGASDAEAAAASATPGTASSSSSNSGSARDNGTRANTLKWLPEIPYSNKPSRDPAPSYHQERTIRAAERDWIIVIESVSGTFVPEILFVVIGGLIILSASIMLAFWFHAHMNRMNKINKMRSDAATEKAALIVETARKQATMERQLNEYIAHVRVLCALLKWTSLPKRSSNLGCFSVFVGGSQPAFGRHCSSELCIDGRQRANTR
jgi:CHASE domain